MLKGIMNYHDVAGMLKTIKKIEKLFFFIKTRTQLTGVDHIKFRHRIAIDLRCADKEIKGKTRAFFI